jgi:hypothetical protein
MSNLKYLLLLVYFVYYSNAVEPDTPATKSKQILTEIYFDCVVG